MVSSYIPIAIFVVVATGFALFTLVFTSLIHPTKYNKVKLEPYECGIEPVTDAPGEPLKAEVSRTDSPGAGASAAPVQAGAAEATPPAPKPANPTAQQTAATSETSSATGERSATSPTNVVAEGTAAGTPA